MRAMSAVEADLTGKTCLITGASSGIGRETAIGLADLGAELYLVCRDRERGLDAIAEIRRRTGNESVELLIADLSSQEEVRKLAGELIATNRPLHVVVNNAGVINFRHTTTVDGIETTFAVNHLAYFLLTHLLLEVLKASAPARIVNVASGVHQSGEITFDDLGRSLNYRAMSVYTQSKLANILFTYELARRLEGTGVTVNCLHPGAVGSRFGGNNGLLARVIMMLGRPFLLTPAQGGATPIYLAASPEVEGVSGRYFVNRKERRSSEASYDGETALRLWDVSEQLCGLSARR